MAGISRELRLVEGRAVYKMHLGLEEIGTAVRQADGLKFPFCRDVLGLQRRATAVSRSWQWLTDTWLWARP